MVSCVFIVTVCLSDRQFDTQAAISKKKLHCTSEESRESYHLFTSSTVSVRVGRAVAETMWSVRPRLLVTVDSNREQPGKLRSATAKGAEHCIRVVVEG